MLPEIKKFAPITPRKPISAVVINTAEFTYRYSTCMTMSPIVLRRSNVHEPDCIFWMDSGLPGTPRAGPQNEHDAAQQQRLEDERSGSQDNGQESEEIN